MFSSKSVCANETLINNALDHQFSFQRVFHAITLAPNLLLVHVYSVKVRSEVLRCAPILFSNFELQLFDSFDQASQIVRSVPLPVVFEPDSIDPFAPILPTHRTSLLGPHPSTKKLPQDLLTYIPRYNTPFHAWIPLLLPRLTGTQSMAWDTCAAHLVRPPAKSPRILSPEKKQDGVDDRTVHPLDQPSSLNNPTLDHPTSRHPSHDTHASGPPASPQPPPGRPLGLLDPPGSNAHPISYLTATDPRVPQSHPRSSSPRDKTNACMRTHATIITSTPPPASPTSVSLLSAQSPQLHPEIAITQCHAPATAASPQIGRAHV